MRCDCFSVLQRGLCDSLLAIVVYRQDIHTTESSWSQINNPHVAQPRKFNYQGTKTPNQRLVTHPPVTQLVIRGGKYV
jgi:hypothetical protein